MRLREDTAGRLCILTICRRADFGADFGAFRSEDRRRFTCFLRFGREGATMVSAPEWNENITAGIANAQEQRQNLARFKRGGDHL
jgi:hypothetical protein